MDLAAFRALLSPAGQEILQEVSALAPRESDFLIHYQSLSRRFPPDLARLALETAILRREATHKFPFADKLYLTRQALEQASSFEISSYRAARYKPFQTIADLACSVGSDTLALANVAPTLGIDLDRLRLSMASANLQAIGLADHTQLLQSDLSVTLPMIGNSSALFFDPSRRSGDHRVFSVHQYQPPLSIINNWLVNFPAIGVKLSPGVDLSELDEYHAEIEFISLHGELKEALLWFGPLKNASRRATILPGPHQLAIDGENISYLIPNRISEPLAFLYEPDPAIIRSGLVTNLAEILKACQMDTDIAYLTSDTFTPSPFVRCWEIVDWMPFNLKRLRAYLRQRHIGQVTVKKRGSPLKPDFLIHQLRLTGYQECILALTHLRGEPIVMICKGV